MKRIVRQFAIIIFSAIAATGCATYETYENVQASELNPRTLSPGDKLSITYDDGTQVDLKVADASGEYIVTESGHKWSKSGIRSLTIRIEPDSGDCGSLASWKNSGCWEGEISPELCRKTSYLICPSIGKND